MSRTIFQITALSAFTIGTGCFVSPADASLEFYDFLLDGSQEVPSTDTLSFGFGQFVYDTDTMSFDLDLILDGIALSDLTASPAHIHYAPFGESGPVLINLLDYGDFFEIDTDVLELSISDVSIGGQFGEDFLHNGDLYVNIHTAAFPAGEIRGQIVPAPSVLAIAGLGGLGFVSRRRR